MRTAILYILICWTPVVTGQDLEVFGGIQFMKYRPPELSGWEKYSMQPVQNYGIRLSDLKFGGSNISLAVHLRRAEMEVESVVRGYSTSNGIPVSTSIGNMKQSSWTELGVSFYPYRAEFFKHRLHVGIGIEANWTMREVSYQTVYTSDTTRYLTGERANFRERTYFHAVGRAAFSIPVKAGFEIIPQYIFSAGLSPEISSKAKSIRHTLALGVMIPYRKKSDEISEHR